MNIFEEIVETLNPVAFGAKVHKIVKGRIYVAVDVRSLDGGRAIGLAYFDDSGNCCESGSVDGIDLLDTDIDIEADIDIGIDVDIDASKLLTPLAEEFPVVGEKAITKRAISVAVACALSQFTLTKTDEGDILERLKIVEGEGVVLVGGFPFAPKIAKMGANLTVFDKKFADFDENKMNLALSKAEVIIITSATLSNGTLPKILDNVGDAREVILLGPTTPLIPVAFASTPITWLMGVIPMEIEKVMEVVASGFGTRGFSKYVKKVGVRVG
jgi:uncharacterized protein